MIKPLVLFTLFALMVSSCSNDSGLCECVEATEKVNDLSASFLDGSYSEERRDSLESARTVSDSLCVKYEQMAPDELHKAARNCSSLKMNPPE